MITEMEERFENYVYDYRDVDGMANALYDLCGVNVGRAYIDIIQNIKEYEKDINDVYTQCELEVEGYIGRIQDIKEVLLEALTYFSKETGVNRKKAQEPMAKIVEKAIRMINDTI